MKRKRKNEQLRLYARSLDVITAAMLLMYTLIILSATNAVWVFGRPFVAVSLAAVLIGWLLGKRWRWIGAAVTVGAGLLQSGVLIGLFMAQGAPLWIAIVTTLLYILPILTLGWGRMWLILRQPPDSSDTLDGQDTTRLALHDESEAPAYSDEDKITERRTRRMQWHVARNPA